MPLMNELTDGGGGAPAGTMTLHGWQPSQAWYKTQVETEPGYVAWKANADQARMDAGTQRRAAMQALALQYGGMPTSYKDAFGDLTPDMLAVDANNPNSQLNQLAASYATQQQQLQQSLATRGALHSGDLVYGQGQLANQYQSNLADAATAFGNAAAGYGGDFAKAWTDAYSGQGDAINQAMQALEAMYPAGTGGDTTATLDPNWSSTYGIPVYSAPDGTLYQIGPTGDLVPYDNSQNRQLSGGGGGGAGAPAPQTPADNTTYDVGGVLYDAATGLPVGQAPPKAPGAAGYSNLVYYQGGGPLGRPQGPGSVAYY